MKESEYAALFDVGLTRGRYQEVSVDRIKIYREEIVQDDESLLDKVIEPSTMGITEHGRLLQMLVGQGYSSAMQRFAVGPVLDTDGHPVRQQIRIVRYDIKR